MSYDQDDQSVVSLNRLDATKLSYNEMTVDSSGGIMTREVKLEWRQKLGYCTTCTERPVLLFTLKRSRLNPLWQNKQPRSVPGECENGVCLRCQREQQQNHRQPKRHQKVHRFLVGALASGVVVAGLIVMVNKTGIKRRRPQQNS